MSNPRARMRTLRSDRLPSPARRKPLRRLAAVEQDGNVIVYECQTCKRRHRYVMVNPDGSPLSDAACKFYRRWHDGEHGSTSGWCPYCAEEK